MKMPYNKFKAVFNPFTRELAVLYGNKISNYTFPELDSWVAISLDGNAEKEQYLHVHLDYDERLQLLFYPRIDGDEELNEKFGSFYYFGQKFPDDKIVLALNDHEFSIGLDNLDPIKNPIIQIDYE